MGIGEAAYGPVAPTVISDFYPVEIRGKVLAWFYMAIPVGSALGYTLGGQVAALGQLPGRLGRDPEVCPQPLGERPLDARLDEGIHRIGTVEQRVTEVEQNGTDLAHAPSLPRRHPHPAITGIVRAC